MRHRFWWVVSILLVLGTSGVSTRASEIPVFFVTQGTAAFGTTEFNSDALSFSFSGPGVNIGGAEATPFPCRLVTVGVTAGSIFTGTVISPLQTDEFNAGGTVGGFTNFLLRGRVDISATALILNPTTTPSVSSGLVETGGG